MDYNIKVDEGKYKYGYIKGRIDNYYWYALVHKEKMDFGINPFDLETGEGRVSRLCLYKEFCEQEGNPYLPSSKVRRYIYANYRREWDVLNNNHEKMVKELVNYLERRYSLKVLKN